MNALALEIELIESVIRRQISKIRYLEEVASTGKSTADNEAMLIGYRVMKDCNQRYLHGLRKRLQQYKENGLIKAEEVAHVSNG
jgi:hypothetical protein